MTVTTGYQILDLPIASGDGLVDSSSLGVDVAGDVGSGTTSVTGVGSLLSHPKRKRKERNASGGKNRLDTQEDFHPPLGL